MLFDHLINMRGNKWLTSTRTKVIEVNYEDEEQDAMK